MARRPAAILALVDGRQGHRILPWTGGFVLLAALFVGLLAMHGVQSTPSPADGSGLPGAHLSRGAPPAHAGAMSGTDLADVIAPAGDPADGMPVHQHPGGQVCLGLFIAAWLLLMAMTLGRRVDLPGAVGTVRARRREDVRSPPPSIFQLSVLRL
jgi:hypothetical protein